MERRGIRAVGKSSRKEERGDDKQVTREVQLRTVGVDPPETGRKMFRVSWDGSPGDGVCGGDSR